MDGFDFLEETPPPQPQKPPVPARSAARKDPGRKPSAELVPVNRPASEPPPHNIQAEAYVLSCMLFDADAIRIAAIENLRVDAFHAPSHRVVANSIIRLMQGGRVPSMLLVADDLHQRGELDEVGGLVGLNELAGTASTTAHFRPMLEVVQRHAALRTVALDLALANQAIKDGNVDDLGVVLTRLSKHNVAGFGHRNLPLMRDVMDITFEKALAMPEEVIKGVLHRGCKIVIGGGSKSRKTWALIDLAISIATGREWWGLETVRGKVAYVNFEIIEPKFAERCQKVMEVKGVRCKSGMLHVWTLRGHAKPVAEIAEDLMRELEAGGYALIIVDPIYKLFDGLDENKAGDVLAVMNRIEQVAVKTGAAIAFAAHFTKGNQAGKEAMDRIGGSGVFGRDPDAIVTMTRHEDEGSYVIETSLRNCEELAPFCITWKFPLFERDEALSPLALKQPANTKRSHGGSEDKASRGRPSQYRTEDLLAYYPGSQDPAMTPAEAFREARADGFAAQQRTLFYFQKQMLEHGWIESTDGSKRYRRTELGDSVIRQEKEKPL